MKRTSPVRSTSVSQKTDQTIGPDANPSLLASSTDHIRQSGRPCLTSRQTSQQTDGKETETLRPLPARLMSSLYSSEILERPGEVRISGDTGVVHADSPGPMPVHKKQLCILAFKEALRVENFDIAGKVMNYLELHKETLTRSDGFCNDAMNQPAALDYLLANGFRPSETAILDAIREENHVVLKICLLRGCISAAVIGKCMAGIICRHDIQAIELLLEFEVVFDAASYAILRTWSDLCSKPWQNYCAHHPVQQELPRLSTFLSRQKTAPGIEQLSNENHRYITLRTTAKSLNPSEPELYRRDLQQNAVGTDSKPGPPEPEPAMYQVK